MKIMTIILASFVSLSAFAHEGHNHDGPATVAAPKGGLIKSLEQLHVEVTNKKDELRIFIYGTDMKPRSTKDIQISAKTQLPRTKEPQDLTLTAKDTHFEAQYDAKGAHRYTLILSIRDSKESHSDKLTFTIEPKK